MNTNMVKDRIYTYDIIRGLSALWIVCLWHLADYYQGIHIVNLFYNKISYSITSGVLAIFSFISGLFLTKYEIKCKSDIFYFYKKRLSRFFILLTISLITLTIVKNSEGDFWISSTYNLIMDITGLCAFTNCMPKTLWFFDMLLLFYVMTPIIQIFKDKYKKVTILYGYCWRF